MEKALQNGRIEILENSYSVRSQPENFMRNNGKAFLLKENDFYFNDPHLEISEELVRLLKNLFITRMESRLRQ